MPIPLSFRWRHALFSNWPVDPALVTEQLPSALTVQTYNDVAWLTVVPFRNVFTRPRGLPALVGLSFPELNLRTYVQRAGEPGVYFFSLDVPSRASVIGARLFHHLPYYHADMRMARQDSTIEIQSRRTQRGEDPVDVRIEYEPVGDRFTAPPESLAAFLTERRRLYTTGYRGELRYTDVTHEPWPLSSVAVSLEVDRLFHANGFDAPDTAPIHYYSRGVDVTTSWNRRWKPTD